MEALSVEVRRIVYCPYVPTLKPLNDVLQSDHCAVDAWGQANSCLIGPLVEAVLEDLSSGPSYALDILSRLSSILAFRNAVFEQNPLLLDTLLRKVVESDSNYEKYAQTCLALLQEPFEIPMPASFPSFLSSLSKKAVQSMTYETIEPLYQAFSSVRLGDLSFVPSDAILQLQDSLITILKTSNVEEVSTSLFGLAVLAKISSYQVSCMILEDSAAPSCGQMSKNTHAVTSGRQFFSTEKASKTLDLVVLKAILLCSRGCTLEPSRISRSLKACAEIIDIVQSSERSLWTMGNSVKLKKLYEKIVRSDIGRDVQKAALLLPLALMDGQALPDEIVATIEMFLCTLHCLSTDPKTVARFLNLLNNEALTRLFHVLLETTCKPTFLGSELQKICNAAILARCFAEAREISTKFAPILSRMMSTSEGQTLVRPFLSQTYLTPCNQELEAVDFCRCAYREAILTLRNSIKIVLLNSAILCPMDVDKGFTSDLLSLLEPQKNFQSGSCPERIVRVMKPPISILNANGIPQSVCDSRSWRDRLLEDMLQDANKRSETVIRMVGEVCRDLELRCDEAELPLRNEQFKVHELEREIQQYESKLHKLEEESQSSQHQMDRLRDEKDGFHEQLRFCEQRLHGMNCKQNRLQKELDATKTAAHHAADIAAESGRQQDLAYLAILTGKDEMIEGQTLKLAANEQQNDALEESIARLRSQQVTMAETVQADRRIIEDLKKTQSELNDLLSTKEANIECLVRSKISLTANVDSVTRQAEETASKNDDIIAGLRSQMLASETENQELRDQHHRETAEEAAASLFLAQQAQAEVASLQNELLQARREATQSLARCDSTIAELEGKILILQQERQVRAHEFAEAQELSSKLMAIVGKKQNSSLGSTKKSRLSGYFETGIDRRHSASQEVFQDKIIEDRNLPPPPSANSNRFKATERSKHQRNVTSPPISSADASFASDCAETNSTSAAVWTNREPLTSHFSAPNRGPVALKHSKSPSKTFCAPRSESKSIDQNAQALLLSDEFMLDSEIVNNG